RCSGLTSMGRLVPANEQSNTFLDPYRGPIAELAFRAPQVGRGEPHVPRLVAVAFDAHVLPQGPSDQVDQPVEPHALPAADVDGLGDPGCPRPAGPLHGGQDAIHAVRNIGIVPLARPIAVHADRLPPGDEAGETMDGQSGPLAGPGEG